MAPRANKRAKTVSELQPVANGLDNDVASSKPALTAETLGHRGFLALPDELVYLIFSHYAEIRVQDIRLNLAYLPGCFLDRFNALRTLSQLCQLSRKMYLPLLWERVQVCIVTKGAWYREHGNSLVRKCNGLLESQYLWPYVRTITVCITRFETQRVLPPFVRLLETLPNIQTLEISHTHRSMTSILKSYFKGKIFPTIQNIILPTCAHEILRCCPGIRDVTCNEGDGSTLVSAMISAGCSNLEVIDGIAAGPVLMKRLTNARPPLKRVRVGLRDPEETIKSFSKFPSLRIIEINGHDWNVDHLVKIADDTLRECAKCPIDSLKKGRKGTASIKQDCTNPIDPNELPDTRMVRVLRFTPLGPKYLLERGNWTAAYFVPKIEEFQVS